LFLHWSCVYWVRTAYIYRQRRFFLILQHAVLHFGA